MGLRVGCIARIAQRLLSATALCAVACGSAQARDAVAGHEQARAALALEGEATVIARTQGVGTIRWLDVGSGSLRLVRNRAAARAASTLPDAALDSMIADAAHRFRHDGRLIKAIIHVESHFNAAAVSPKGAIGLMQVMPATGKRLGIEDPGLQLFDAETNVNAGAKYLRLLMDLFAGEPHLAIAAYNAGEAAVLRYGRRIPPFRETQDYVQRVLAQYEIYSAQ
jgi:soluble lytic murein transglycosylase-like protein